MIIKRPKSKQPIPDNAKMVFSGDMFSVYQWPQKQYNGEYATFEKLKRSDTVAVLPVMNDGKIALSKQEQPGTAPFYGLFGGRIDEGEDPVEAVKRELMEEAGMEASELIFWEANQPIDKIEWINYCFIAKNCRIVQDQNPDPGEKIEILLVNFEEFIEISARQDFRDSEISLKLFRAILEKKKMAELKKLLFDI